MCEDDRDSRDALNPIMDPVESIEEMLRKCGFFDTVVPNVILREPDDGMLPN